MQPGSVVADIPTASSRKNYAGSYYGLVSAREALTHSYNVSADSIYRKILGENPGKKYLMKMGIPLSEEEQEYASIALGGLTYGMTVEQNTNAFATLSNKGKYVSSYMIEKITDSDGNIIYEHEKDPVKVFSPQSSYLTLDIMRDVISIGTAGSLPSRLKYGGVDWAGKTGTSNDYRDAWFVGTNPNVTLGTWIGYDTPSSIYCSGCGLSYSQRNQYLWANFINALTDINPELMAPKEAHKRPDGIVSRSYCATSGLAASDLCSQAGLVRSDIYDAKYVPNKTDDSLVGGNMPLVTVDGDQIIAGPKTPSEFTTSKGGGFTFNADFLNRNGYNKLGDLSLLIPRRNPEAWKKISVGSASSSSSSGAIEKDNGKNPPAPKVKASDSSLSWDSASGNLIVGYRIYQAKEEGGSTKLIGHTTDTSYKLPGSGGAYYVKAVNYFGRESGLSNPVQSKAEKDKHGEDAKKDKDKDKKKDDKNKDKENNNNKNEEDNGKDKPDDDSDNENND